VFATLQNTWLEDLHFQEVDILDWAGEDLANHQIPGRHHPTISKRFLSQVNFGGPKIFFTKFW